MRTSATEFEPANASATLREATRRLLHHASNAANAAAVNVEVLRSRLARGGAPAEALNAFADRAAGATEHVSGAVTAIRALLVALADVVADGQGRLRPVRGDPDAVELLIDTTVAVDSGARRFAEAAGVVLSTSGRGIILKVLRREPGDTNATS